MTKESQSKKFYRAQNSYLGIITVPAPALSSTQRLPPIQCSQGNSNQIPTQTSHRRATPRISPDPRHLQLVGTTCVVARASRGDIYPTTVSLQLRIIKLLKAHETHIPLAAQARARRAMRHGSEMPAWHGEPARRRAERAVLSR